MLPIVVTRSAHNSEIPNEIDLTSLTSNLATTKKVSQAYLDLFRTITNNELPKNLTSES